LGTIDVCSAGISITSSWEVHSSTAVSSVGCIDASSISGSVSSLTLESSTAVSSVDTTSFSGSVSNNNETMTSLPRDFLGVAFLNALEGKDLLLTGVFFDV